VVSLHFFSGFFEANERKSRTLQSPAAVLQRSIEDTWHSQRSVGLYRRQHSCHNLRLQRASLACRCTAWDHVECLDHEFFCRSRERGRASAESRPSAGVQKLSQVVSYQGVATKAWHIFAVAAFPADMQNSLEGWG
jgi:hypothetical protein